MPFRRSRYIYIYPIRIDHDNKTICCIASKTLQTDRMFHEMLRNVSVTKWMATTLISPDVSYKIRGLDVIFGSYKKVGLNVISL